MSLRALQIALALSLVLNAGLLAGAVFGLFAEERGHDAEAHIEAVAEELDLSAAAVAGLRDFRERTIAALAARRQDAGRDDTRRQLVEMLDDETYDRAAVQAILGARSDARNAFWSGVGADLHRWVRTLPEDKQARFVEMAKDKAFFRKLFARDE